MLVNARLLRERNLSHGVLDTLVRQASDAIVGAGAAAGGGASGGAARRRYAYADFGPFYEQSLLSAWLAVHPQLVTELPCRWNRRLNATCADPLPGVRHASRKLGVGWSQHARDEAALARLLLPTPDAVAAGPSPPMVSCAAARLQPELRGSAAAAAECEALAPRVNARRAIRPWRERYLSLECARARM